MAPTWAGPGLFKIMGEDVIELPLSIRELRDQFLKKIVKSEASVERVFIRHKLIHSPLIHSENSSSHETDLLHFSSLFEQIVEIICISKPYSETVNRKL